MEKNKFLLIYLALPALLLLIAASKSFGPSEWAGTGGGFRAPARFPGRRKYLLTDADGQEGEVYEEPADWSYEQSSHREVTPGSHQSIDRQKSGQRIDSLQSDVKPITGDTSRTVSDKADTPSAPSSISVIDSSRIGTKAASPDSVSQVDSMKLSAWLQHMRPVHVQAPIFEPYHYPLFLTSNAVQYSTLPDSTGRYMEIRETALGHDIRIPLQVPLDEYIKLERRHLIKETWATLAHAYILRKVGGLESLMAGVTNIDIPIPSNPVLSIFGPPRINLQVSGAVDIQGGWQNQKLNAQTLSQLGNVTNQPAFNQSLQINVNGTIGNKLNIAANWDTQNQFNYENQVKLKYTGYPDEIVKSVEAGNVSMNTPSSFIGNSQALFGLKAKFQFGPLTLTALASQQKGQSKTLTVSNGSSSQTFSLHAYQFATNYFFIDTMYIGEYERYYQNNGNQFDANKLVTNYEVYISQPSSALNTNLRKGYAVIDLPSIQEDPGLYTSLANGQVPDSASWKVESGYFEKLTSSEFSIDPRTGVLTLNTSFQSNQVVAIAFSTNSSVYGTFGNTDTSNLPLVLNMIVPANPLPSETDAWRLMLRNIYPTGGLNLTQNSLKDVQIVYTVPGQASQNTIDNINLLQVFGLDKTGPNGTGPPDGVMDWNPGIDIDPSSGDIILPYLEPFVEAFNDYVGPQGQKIATPDSFTYSAIYDTTLQSAENDFTSRDRFLITGSYTSSVTSHYNLGFNLVQGSVKVLLNGSPLTEGSDYTVDYVTGEVQILDQAALQPGANVQIQYQTNDLFQLASKSLSGLRADYRVNKNTDIGFTLMNYSQQSPVSNIQLGQEPISNLMLEADAGTILKLPFLTTALNALPILQTTAPSSITMHGEAAYMLPNPNTSQSVIPDDHHQGMAYIDNFEGAKKTIPLPITFSNWTMASPPAVSVLDSLHPGIVDSVKNYYRAWTYWYNRLPGETSVKDIWPQKQVASNQQTQTVLSVGMLDTVRGQFNRAKNLDSTLLADPSENWGGMMTLLSSNASDLLSQNITYIEIWMKIENAPGPGTMHIDLGQISEDVIGDGVLHTEDPYGYNALISDTLDYGIDGINDAKERADFPWIVADPGRPWDPTGQDPDGDDYYFPPNPPLNPPDSMYYRVNGTEGNHVASWGKFPDTEDLNHNGTLDLQNNYFEYAVKLDTTHNKFIAGGGNQGWFQYIIPLQDYARAVGSPTLTNVQYVRMWFNGMTAPMRIKIAKIELVGNYWKTPNPNDSTMQVSVVSIEDNPGYTPPAPGLRPVVNSSTSGPLLGNEQSLALILNGLQDDSTRYVYKVVPQALNVFNYRTMKMYVHGDPSFNYVDSSDYDAAVYLRFGTDANNFYEYRQPIKPGWQDFVIDLARLTSLKETRDSVNQAIPPVPANNGTPGSTYWVQGNPSLQDVTYFQIGVTNPPHTGTPLPLTGEIWVDVLRLTNVNNTPGLAYQLSSNLQLADLGSISFNYTSVSPYFHSLTTQFGNMNAQLNWGISGSFNLSRFLPRAWIGTSIPFYYNHTESFANPLYLPNSDVLVTEAVQRRTAFLMKQGFTRSQAATLADSLLLSSQSLTINDQWSISNMRIVFPSNQWYVKDIVDNITMGFNWSGSRFRNTQTRYGNQWSWQYNAGYSVQLDPMAFITPFASSNQSVAERSSDFQIRYLPNSFNLSMNANRSLTLNDLWSQTTPILTPNFIAQRGGGFTWQLTNNGILNPSISYNFSDNSSLVSIESDTNSVGALNLLPDSYVFRQIFLNGGLINFGEDYAFTEQFALSTSPHLPLGIQKYLNLQASYSSGYQWNNSAQQGALGKSAGFNSTLQLGTNLYLKSLTDPWFAAGTAAPSAAPGPGRRRGREEFAAPKPDTSSGNTPSIGQLLDYLIKIPFLDFQNIGFNFSSTNTATNGGLPSLRPGMGNFFSLPFIQQSNPELGPSQLYQLGLVSDPYGALSLKPKKTFPFFKFSLGPTKRVAINGVNITDNFSNSNNLTITTSRNLWAGAQLNLSWNVAWSYNRNTTFTVDSAGNVILNSISTQISGQVTKSFFSIPPVFIFSAFKSGINQVAADYKKLNSANSNSTPAQNLSKAFLQGFETFPILDKVFGEYAPDLNYSFSWDGLENLPLFKTFASQVSLNNAYQSSYSRSWTNTNGQGEVTNDQSVSYGFQPLMGMNIAFKNFTNATISGSVLYNTSTQYSLNPSAQTIAESYTGQLSINAQYEKQGLSLPFLGLNLKNNINISASYSVSQTTSYSYQVQDISAGSTPIDGTSQISIDLQFQYSLSSSVTASLYYKNTRIVPTAPGSPIPGTTTNEAGVNVHVSIGS